jgi:hypothetical protein
MVRVAAEVVRTAVKTNNTAEVGVGLRVLLQNISLITCPQYLAPKTHTGALTVIRPPVLGEEKETGVAENASVVSSYSPYWLESLLR